MTICLVTDRRQLSPDARTSRDEALALARWLEEAPVAGVDLIQLRERDLPPRQLAGLVRAVRTALAGSTTRVVVNDRADVAMAADADGVHLRGDGPRVSAVRALAERAGATWLIGRSVHSVADVKASAGADYVLFGAVFNSGPKPGLGLEALRQAVAASRPPVLRAGPPGVIAIGGLTVPRAVQCLEAGATGIAAIRLFLPPARAEGALGMAAAVLELRCVFDAAAKRHLQ